MIRGLRSFAAAVGFCMFGVVYACSKRKVFVTSSRSRIIVSSSLVFGIENNTPYKFLCFAFLASRVPSLILKRY